MPYEVDWLTGALTRGMLESHNGNYTGQFVALDAKRVGEEKSFSDGDCKIFAAVNRLRNFLEQSKVEYALYRYGGDEFVLITTEKGIEKIRKSKAVSELFYFAIERKEMGEMWVEAFDRAWEKIKRHKHRLDRRRKS